VAPLESPDRLDLLFRSAVAAIDAGDGGALERLLSEHPRLVRDRLESPGPWLRDKVGKALDSFFQRPYLLWFVAEDPVRHGKLPANITKLAGIIIQAAKRQRIETLQEQLDYALRLVSWSWIARECGVQIALIDALVDAGADPAGCADNALVNHNLAAAGHLVARGAPLTLGTALCLGRWDDLPRLAKSASPAQRQFAFVLSALHGGAEALRRMIALGVDVNAPSQDLYSHGTPLHHAVCSGSLEAVEVLVNAGAKLTTKDTAWHATPFGWAEYYAGENWGSDRAIRYSDIARYLRERSHGGGETIEVEE
jgi:hypothetical protein